MTISTTIRKAGPYKGDGVAVSFPFDFKIFAKEDLVVTFADAAGIEKKLNEGTDFAVILHDDQEQTPGGFVYIEPALQAGTSITISSGMAYLQPTKITNQGGFYPAVLNNTFDRMVIYVQQLAEQLERSVKVDISSGQSAQEYIDDIQNKVDTALEQTGSAVQSMRTAVRVPANEYGVVIPSHVDRADALLGFGAGGLPKSVKISDGLSFENDLIKVKAGVGIVSQPSGVSVVYGDGLGSYDNAIVVKLGNGLDFDEQSRVQITSELIETIRSTKDGLMDLKGFVAQLAVRVAKLEAGGGEVAIYLGNGLHYNPQGEVAVKPHTGILVDNNGVSIKIGEGLEIDVEGNVKISGALQQEILAKANAQEVEEGFISLQNEVDAKADAQIVEDKITNLNGQISVKADVADLVVKRNVDPYTTLGYPIPMGYSGSGAVQHLGIVPGASLTFFGLVMSRNTHGPCAGYMYGLLSGSWQNLGGTIGDWNGGGSIVNLPISIWRRVA